MSITTVNHSYNMTIYDEVVRVVALGPTSIGLPPLSSLAEGKSFTIIDVGNSAGTNNITIGSSDRSLINGHTLTLTINLNGGALTFTKLNGGWSADDSDAQLQLEIADSQANVSDLQIDTSANAADISTLQSDVSPLITDVAQLQLDVDSLQFNASRFSVTLPFTLPAPAVSAVTKDFIAFKAPANGELLSVEIIPNSAWASGNNVGDKYLASAYRYNNTPAVVNFSHDLMTGLAAGASARLPSGTSNQLLTVGQTLSLTATGTSVKFNSSVTWVTLPAVGDYVTLTGAATAYVGATPANPGVYIVTALTAVSLTATKLFGAAPENVASGAAGSGEVAALRLVRAQEASFAAGDVIGMRIVVPIDTTTPVDVSSLAFSAIFNYSLT